MATRQSLNGGHFSSAAFSRSSYSRIVTGQGVLEPPTDAIFMRVAAIGAGSGSNDVRFGGGGGGAAASKVVKAQPVTYSIGRSFANNAYGEDTVITFTGYRLIGKGGGTPIGGMGEGGDFNYKGGDGGVRTSVASAFGGGAAGPMGNGDGADNLPTLTNIGWGVGGGVRGLIPYSSSTACNSATGGAGTGSAINATTTRSSAYASSTSIPSQWGTSPHIRVKNGGEMGGGASHLAYYVCNESRPKGGDGGMVVEWFYR